MDGYREGLWKPLDADLGDNWRALLSTPRHFTDHLCDEVFNSRLFPLQRKAEMRRMRQLIVDRLTSVECILDVGSDKGGGVFHWCEWFPGLRKMIAIEPRGIPYAQLFEAEFPNVEFLWLAASSHTAATQEAMAAFLGDDKLDLAFLDGDKVATAEDFAACIPLARDGACILIHDINMEGRPRDTFTRLAGTYESEAIIDLSELERQSDEPGPTTNPRFQHYAAWLDHWGGIAAGVGVLFK